MLLANTSEIEVEGEWVHGANLCSTHCSPMACYRGRVVADCISSGLSTSRGVAPMQCSFTCQLAVNI